MNAKPAGFVLKNGDAKIIPSPNGHESLLIQSGKHAVIDWESFSIAREEIIRFAQSGNSSYVLNRVLGTESSQILGQLLSNGAVYLINPNGVVIGPSGYVETAGFIASTLDLFKGELDENALRFQGKSQNGVVNEGTIRCPSGDIFLIGRTVENSGKLITENGIQSLLSGCDVLVRPRNAPAVLIRSGELFEDETFEENPYALAIRHTGESIGKEIYLSAGIGLTEVSGSLIALGGTVHVLGDAVHLQEGTRIDVSHETKGGTILVGGDYQGDTPGIKNAKRTFVEKGVELIANAKDQGNGGKVILWGDEANFFYGNIDIRGGQLGGDGGFAEVSAKYLEYQGTIDGFALGKPSTVLLDPTDILISGTAPATNGNFLAGIWTSINDTAIAPSTTHAISIQTLLRSGVNVTINTSTALSGPFSGVGNITWAPGNDISWNAPTTLTLIADSVISINSTITSTNITNFVAMDFTATGIESGENSAITVSENLSASGGHIILRGTANAIDFNDVSGVLFTGSGKASTISGNISVTGVLNGDVTTTSGSGVRFDSPNALMSESGSLTVTGRGLNSYGTSFGVHVNAEWNTGLTANTITFANCTATGPGNIGVYFPAAIITNGNVVFDSCTSGNGSGGAAVSIAADSSIGGNLVATAISTTTGSGKTGWLMGANLNVTKDVQISATSNGTSGNAHGIWFKSNAILSANGSITLNGTSSNAHGIFFESGRVTTSTGAIALNGIASGGSGINSGLRILANNAITSTSGDILLQGSSAALGDGSHGLHLGAMVATGTSGKVTFSNCSSNKGSAVNIGADFSTLGDVCFTNCTSAIANAVAINAPCTMGGNLVATNNITATATGWNNNAALIAKSIEIRTTSTGAAHAISIATGSITASSGTLTLSGFTTGANNTNYAGINVENTLSSPFGAIVLTGVSNGSHGVSLTATQTILTPSLAFLNCAGGQSHGVHLGAPISTSDITFTGCTAGVSGYGVNIAAPLTVLNNIAFNSCTTSATLTVGGGAVNIGALCTIGGNLTAMDLTTGSGANNVGLRLNANIFVGGSTNITASSSSNMGNATGIALVSGTLNSVGPIYLYGSATGASNGASVGVNFLNGRVAGEANTIVITGNSNALTTGSHGVLLPSTGWDIETTGQVTFAGSSTNAFPICVPNTLSTKGALTFTNGVGLGTGLNASITIASQGLLLFSSTLDEVGSGSVTHLTVTPGIYIVSMNGNVGTKARLASLTIDEAATGFTLGTAASSLNIDSLTVSGTVPTKLNHVGTTAIYTNNGDVSFGGTINGITANAQSLSINAGSGQISFAGNIGTEVSPPGALGVFRITSGATISFRSTVSTIHTAAFDIANSIPTIFEHMGTTTINTSSAGGDISFGGTIDGLNPGAHDLVFTAGSLTGGVLLVGNVGSHVPLGNIIVGPTAAGGFTLGTNLSEIHANSLLIDYGISTTVSCVGTTNILATEEIFFGGMLRGLSAGNQNLTLNTNGPISFLGNIGSNRLGSLQIAAATNVLFDTSLDAINANSLIVGTNIPVIFSFDGLTSITTTTAPGVSFGGTVDTITAGSQHLLFNGVNAGKIVFLANVGSQTAPGDITIQNATGVSFGPSTDRLIASSLSIGSNIPTQFSFAGTTALTTTAGISFGGAVLGYTAYAQNILLRGGSGSVTFSGNIGSSETILGNLNVVSGSNLLFGNSVTAVDVNELTIANIPTTFMGDGTTAISTHGDIFFGGTLNSQSGAHNLTFATTENLFFADAIGNTAPFNALLITSVNNVTTSAPVTASSLVQSSGTGLALFNDTVTTSGDIAITSSQFIFNDAVTANNLTIAATSVKMNGAVNAHNITVTNTDLLLMTAAAEMNLSGSFVQNGTGVVHTAANIKAAGDISFLRAITLVGDVALNAGQQVTFSNTIDGAKALSVSGKNILFSNTVGSIDTLSALSVNAQTITVTGDHSVFAGPMSYSGHVLLTNDLTFTNSGSGTTTFKNSPIAISGTSDCTILANNTNVDISGHVDLSGDKAHENGSNFSVEGGFGVNIAGDILTTGYSTDGTGGDVSCTSLGGSIAVANINASGNRGGDIYLSPSAGYSEELPSGIVTLNGNLTSSPVSSHGGTIKIDAGRATHPRVATIVSGGNDVAISAKSFEMGINETMTIFGSLEITSVSTTLSNTVATKDLTILTSITHINTRGPVQLLNSSGELYTSPTVHLLAGGSYYRSGALSPSKAPLLEKTMNFSPSSFQSLLLLGDLTLSFDPTLGVSEQDYKRAQSIMYKITVADAQLSDMLPVYKVWPKRFVLKRKAP